MKKVFAIALMLIALISFTACKSTSSVSKPEYINNPNFTEFSLDDDLSWLEGVWELVKWETNEHGKYVDNTYIFEYQTLKINGSSKTSQVIEESKSSKDKKASRHEYTLEKYLTLNNHTKGHANKVNKNKDTLLICREYALDPEVIFHYAFKKKQFFY